LAEDTKSLDLPALINKIEILKGMVEHNEGKRLAASRASNSRDPQNAMDFDGPSDSPVPSPAENKHIRKMGPGRPSSQPPRDKDSLKEEKEERVKEGSSAARTRITFELNEEVAFKPKIANQTQEQDWIKGIVVKVIGEGKSRRYDVRDAEPDDPNKPVVYRSSASSMVPIPSEGTPLPDYEAGKRVLALYPRTSTYYRAEVQGMTADKKKVRLLFEEESLEEIKEVDRHDVLDHKG
jgi:SAGA-associated factor 29